MIDRQNEEFKQRLKENALIKVMLFITMASSLYNSLLIRSLVDWVNELNNIF